ncbi:hypothetical protein LINGRAHAP2_LOCUS23204, partial [Linum grandiflorum]
VDHTLWSNIVNKRSVSISTLLCVLFLTFDLIHLSNHVVSLV